MATKWRANQPAWKLFELGNANRHASCLDIFCSDTAHSLPGGCIVPYLLQRNQAHILVPHIRLLPGDDLTKGFG